MLVIKDIPTLLNIISKWKKERNSISLVPTMGNLHDGHINLVHVGKSNAEKVIVSIFVNPIQFNELEDFLSYPLTIQKDYENLQKNNVDAVFSPHVNTMYPNGILDHTFIDIPYFSNILEGKSRPGHFRGVITIVSKLFNLIQPDIACFGEKDFQQLFLIRRLVHDMNYHIKIISIPTVRCSDGLAFSSRNNNLNKEERKVAPNLYKVLIWSALQLKSKISIDNILAEAKKNLIQNGFIPDVLAIQDADTLQPLLKDSQKAVILFSAWIGKTRLIDNIQVILKT